MIRTEVSKLTPELAAHFLNNNTTNRPVSKSTVERYERAINRGEWMLNGEPIIVFSDGTLGDGQHRCLAVQKTGKSIDTIIMYGIDPETFKTINGGKSRNNADVLAITGEVNTIVLASAARTYLLTELNGRDANCITFTQIKECVDKHPHLRYWVQRYCQNKKAKIIPSHFCGYLAVASEKYGFEKLDKFFDQVASGENLSQGDPALVLRERFLSQTKASRISLLHAQAFVVKAINAHLMGKKIALLRLSDGEAAPKII